jgi:hypothetical protein
MPSRTLRVFTLLSLALLAVLVGAWAWSYVPLPPESHIQRAIERDRGSLERDIAELEERPGTQPAVVKRREQQKLLRQQGLANIEAVRTHHSVPLSRAKGRATYLVSSSGMLALFTCVTEPTAQARLEPVSESPGVWRGVWRGASRTQERVPGRLRFGYYEQDLQPIWGYRISERSFAVPYWLLCLAMLIAPSLWLWSWQRARTCVRQNRCATCGYDLRAAGERCPECGTRRAF